MVGASRSTTGHPLFVAGPQIGYTYPGLTMEVDISYPGVQARGATAPGFAGNILIGRGQDYAWSLTSAGSDLIDTFVETLCGGSRTKYLYKGRCRTMGRVDAGRIAGSGRVVFRTTVHGPVTGYAKVNGRTVALSRQRASYGRDILWQLSFRDLTVGKVQLGRDVPGGDGDARRSRSTSPTPTIATSRCTRPASCRSATRASTRGCPTKGTGEYEWRGLPRAVQAPVPEEPAQRDARQLEQPPGAGLGRGRRQLGVRLRPIACGCCSTNLAKRRQARPRDGHGGDERGRDAGPAQPSR